MDAVMTHLFEGARAAELLPVFADVEAYPSFVPGFKSAKIVERGRDEYKTKIVMSLELGPFTYEEELDSVTREDFPSSIEVCSTGSRFIRSFCNTWRFLDVPRGCDVAFEMTIEFGALPGLVRPMLARLAQMQAERILQAFVARVEATAHRAGR
jgi:ribosome-associated toxin RatA of RatAB toxin-antitoxin module